MPGPTPGSLDAAASLELQAALRVATADLAELARQRARLAELVRATWRGGTRARFDEVLAGLEAHSRRVADAIEMARVALVRHETAGAAVAEGELALRGRR